MSGTTINPIELLDIAIGATGSDLASLGTTSSTAIAQELKALGFLTGTTAASLDDNPWLGIAGFGIGLLAVAALATPIGLEGEALAAAATTTATGVITELFAGSEFPLIGSFLSTQVASAIQLMTLVATETIEYFVARGAQAVTELAVSAGNALGDYVGKLLSAAPDVYNGTASVTSVAIPTVIATWDQPSQSTEYTIYTPAFTATSATIEISNSLTDGDVLATVSGVAGISLAVDFSGTALSGSGTVIINGGTIDPSYVSPPYIEEAADGSIIIGLPNADGQDFIVDDTSGGDEIDIMLGTDGAATGEALIDFDASDFAGNVVNLTESTAGTVDVTDSIGAGDTAEISSDDALSGVSEDFEFTAASETLKIDDPASFSGQISGLQQGDTIDLVGFTATGVTLSTGGVLTVDGSDGASVALGVVGAPKNTTFLTLPDGAGGTDLVLANAIAIGPQLTPFPVLSAGDAALLDPTTETLLTFPAAENYAAGTLTVDGQAFDASSISSLASRSGSDFLGGSSATLVFTSGASTTLMMDPDGFLSSETTYNSTAPQDPALDFTLTLPDYDFGNDALIYLPQPGEVVDRNITASYQRNVDGSSQYTLSGVENEQAVDLSTFVLDATGAYQYTAPYSTLQSAWDGVATTTTSIAGADSSYLDGSLITTVTEYITAGTTQQPIQFTYGTLTSGELTLTIASSAGYAALLDTLNPSLLDLAGAGYSSITSQNDSSVVVMPGAKAQISALQSVSVGIVVNPGASAVVSSPTIDLSGTVASGGELDLNGLVEGNAALEVEANGTLQLSGSVAQGVTISVPYVLTYPLSYTSGTDVSIAGSSLVVIEQPSQFSGYISGFAPGDVVDVGNLAGVQSDSYASGVLNIVALDGESFALNINEAMPALLPYPGQSTGGSLQPTQFEFTPDGSGGTLINLVVSCFVEGTRLAGIHRECPVERLEVGDLLRTSSGGYAPITWIGHRRIDCRRHPRPQDVWPVRVSREAFGHAMPHHEVFLSPDHAVFAEGVLIPIKHLINGHSVTQVRVDEVTYYHVELPQHDVILAEGLPTESYLDTGNKDDFNNGGEVAKLFPDFARRNLDPALVRDAKSFAPLIVCGPELDVTRERLAAKMLLPLATVAAA